MAEQFRLHCDVTDFISLNFYKSIFRIDQPYLVYLGIPKQIYTTCSMFDVQAALVRDAFLDMLN
jgi:hypothetical protein